MAKEIILNHLSLYEYGRYHDKSERNDWEHYKNLVVQLFQIKDLYFFESELISDHKVKTMNELLATYPAKFIYAGKRNKRIADTQDRDFSQRSDNAVNSGEEKNNWKESDFENAWFDIWLERFLIVPDDPYYDEFFVYQLRNLDLLDTDDFLNYQLNTHFENAISTFKRFVSLSLRKHGERLLLPDQIKTVEEWLNMIENKPELSGGIYEKPKKTKLSREQGDNLTSLNLIQTAYFVNLLRQIKVD